MTFELKKDDGGYVQVHASGDQVVLFQGGYGAALLTASEARQVAEALTEAAEEAEEPEEEERAAIDAARAEEGEIPLEPAEADEPVGAAEESTPGA